METKNCIYCLDCQCGRQYIGETKRPFNVRLKEHISNVRKGNTEESRIADHAWSEDHRMNWEKAKIIHHGEKNYFKRKLIEASFMSLAKNPISKPSVEIKPLWLPLIREELEIPKADTNNPQPPKPVSKQSSPLKLRSGKTYKRQ